MSGLLPSSKQRVEFGPCSVQACHGTPSVALKTACVALMCLQQVQVYELDTPQHGLLF